MYLKIDYVFKPMGGLATIKINIPVEKSVRCPFALNPEFKLIDRLQRRKLNNLFYVIIVIFVEQEK